MKFILDKVEKVNNNRRFEICGYFVPDESEKDLYSVMVEAEQTMTRANSALTVIHGKLAFNKAAISGCRAVIDTFKRNLLVDIKCELSKNFKSSPAGCEQLVIMELGV